VGTKTSFMQPLLDMNSHTKLSQADSPDSLDSLL
jgi:hypothetical protein